MEFKKKTIIWEDNNEPPKDYIWVKSDGKAYEYSYSQRKWIESKSISGSNSGGSGSGGDIPSGDITIDDVVKFIHDDLAGSPEASMFPYTTWNEIPDYDSVDIGQICKTTDISGKMLLTMFGGWNYIIGIKALAPQ